ncbi:MAG: hydrogen peroxide-inducible genes activator [Propionivibrio sp.]
MSALPSLKQLQYLVALSAQHNFTRAAASCFVTQSTLSAGLKELEDILGVRLVERDRQSVLMTPIGLEIAARARDILAATQDLVDRAADVMEPMCGTLRLGVIPTIAPFLLPPALRLLRERFPKLRLALREDRTTHLIERLEDGQLDFALIALPFPTETLIIESLLDDPLWLVGCLSDAELMRDPLAVTPALTEHLLLLEEGHCLRDHTLQACGKAGAPSSGAVEATSLLTLLQMVESGLGLALVPEMAVKSGLTASPGLLVRPFCAPAPSRTIALAARRSTSRLYELKALGGVIREACAQLSDKSA